MELPLRLACKGVMSKIIDLTSDQELQAFADGEISPGRKAAVDALLARNGFLKARADHHCALNDVLRSLKDRIYRNRQLREKISCAREMLAAKRAASNDR